GKDQCPDDEEGSHRTSGRCSREAVGYAVAGVGLNNVSPESQAEEHRNHGSPTKPPQGARHEAGNHLAFCDRVHLLQKWHVYEIEKVEHSHPSDASEEMEPAEHDLHRGTGVRKRETWSTEQS